MSLLMDALRKAERQKQQTATQNGLELDPLPKQGAAAAATASRDRPARVNGNQLPELPKQLADLDEQFFANASASPKPLRAHATAPPREPDVSSARSKDPAPASRETVRNVFAAKQPTTTGSHGFALAVGLSALVAAAIIGGYLYWQMQPKGGLSPGPASAQAIPAAAPSASTSMAPAPAAQSPRMPSAHAAAPAEAAYVPLNRPRMESGLGNPAANPDRQTLAPSRPVAAGEVSIRVSGTPRRLDPALERAHQAFYRGEIELARVAWQGALQSDPRNADALHGLAATAQLGGQTGQAVDYYLRALEVDPKDALALSGLASLGASADSGQTGSRLKALLAEQPDSPYLNFALGNLHAQGARWADAQQAYFKAHTADPANPDYLYNLAVSLDHLHQPRLAAQYYERAIDAARRQVAGFDPAQATVRLKTLQSGMSH